MRQIVRLHSSQIIFNKVTFLVTILTLFLSACTEKQATLPITLQPIVAANLLEKCSIKNAIRVESEDLREDLDDYMGQCLSIRETVGKPVGTHTFLLREYHLFGSKTILVFNASGTPFTVLPDRVAEAVLVTGEVHQFTIAEFERDYGIKLDPERYADYENLPVIVAQSLVLAPDPDEVTENPDAFADQVIAVAGEIDDRLAPNIFTLDEEQFIGGEDLLVIGITAIPTFEEDEDVLVVGMLRRFDATTFEQEYDLDWTEVQQQIKVEYTNQPVLAAQAVYRAAD